MDPATWMAFGVAALAVGYVMLRSRRVKSDPLNRTAFGSSSLAQQRAVERQMSNLLVELSEMARALSAGLDTRSAKLEALIDEADRRIADLKRLSDPSPVGAATDSNEPGPTPPVTAPADEAVGPVEVDPRHAEVYAMADSGRSVAEIATALNRHSGEVELILALRPRSASPAAERASA
jgi:DNA-binding NarL/FixJ family response regulator